MTEPARDRGGEVAVDLPDQGVHLLAVTDHAFPAEAELGELAEPSGYAAVVQRAGVVAAAVWPLWSARPSRTSADGAGRRLVANGPSGIAELALVAVAPAAHVAVVEDAHEWQSPAASAFPVRPGPRSPALPIRVSRPRRSSSVLA